MTEKAPKHYRILELRAENIKKLSIVNIRPDGNVVQIVGENGQGKSSVLDAIEWAFAGKRAIQTKPIRSGEETALIKVDLGEIKVTRRFTATEDGGYTTSVKVEGADGSRFSNEQGVLNALIGEFAFDPMAFGRMKPDEQFAAVSGLVPGVDFPTIAAADKADFEARTEINRKVKALTAQANGIVLPPGAIPELVDVSVLEKKLGDAADHNTLLERRQNARTQAEARIQGCDMEIDDLLKRADALRAERAELRKRLDDAEKLPDPIDVTAVREQLAQARMGNEVAQKAAERDKLLGEASLAEKASKALTKAMEDREAAKQAAIAKAKMPVKGLSFGDGEVLLNGEPFAQASRAQQWVASVEIAAALNPRLRVIRILDGSLLDHKTMDGLAALAERLDLQIWIERVSSDGTVGFILEDGHLKGAAPVKPAPAEAVDDVI